MDVGEVKAELQALGNDRFVAQYGRYFLVLTDAASLDDFASFVNTASRAAHELTAGRSMDAVEIYPLQAKKKKAERISIGRDGTCDVIVAHRNVSKLHAYFTLAGGLLSLADAGSKNGTWLNDHVLPAKKWVPVDLGDTVNFGSVSATVWGIDDLVAAVAT